MPQLTVESRDPELSEHANAMLTRELRAVIGKDEVWVDEKPRERVTRRRRSPVLALPFLFFAIVAGIVWVGGAGIIALIVALILLAAGFVAAWGTAIDLTQEVEHLDPEISAELRAEGVADPDHLFTELITRFAGANPTGPGAIFKPGNNRQRREPISDGAAAAVDQQSTLTPGSRPTKPAGAGASDEE